MEGRNRPRGLSLIVDDDDDDEIKKIEMGRTYNQNGRR